MGNIPAPLVIFLVVVVLSAVIGGLAQVLRNQQQAEHTRAANARAASRNAASQSGRSANSDIDRFLEEIDKLRRKPAGDASVSAAAPPPPVARKVSRPSADVPVVEPKRPRDADKPKPSPTPSMRVEDLPVAPVVGPSPKVATPAKASPVSSRSVPTTGSRVPVQSEFGKQLAALLSSKQSVPLAVVLQEVLGPPKCRQATGSISPSQPDSTPDAGASPR